MSTEKTFQVLGFVGRLAFPCASPQLWRDDPVEATAIAAQKLGLAAPNEAMQNALLNSVLLAGRWALSAYPVFQLTHRLAATLMATTVSKEALEDVAAQFYGVTVRIPPDLIFIAGEGGRPESANLLTFSSYSMSSERVSDGLSETRWSYALNTSPIPINGTREALSVWAYHVPQSKLLDNDLPRTWNTMPRSSIDDRADMLVRRLMLGLCLWCSDPKNLGEPVRPSKRNSRVRAERGRRGDILPDFKTWYLGKDIKLDSKVVEAVREFSREGGSSPKVQSLVSGHWKRQVHGRGRKERKLIHVEPYWRGPLDAPVISHGGR